MTGLIYRLIILSLGFIAWVFLFFLDWKMAVLLFFIIWAQNESAKGKK